VREQPSLSVGSLANTRKKKMELQQKGWGSSAGLGYLAAVGVGCLITGGREEGWVHLAAVSVGYLVAGEREDSWVHLGFCGCRGKITKRRREGHVRREGDRKS